MSTTAKTHAPPKPLGKDEKKHGLRRTNSQPARSDDTRTPSGSINWSSLELGSVHDNAEVLIRIKLEMRMRQSDALDLLNALRRLEDHVSSSPDPKSHALLSEIRATIGTATRLLRDSAARLGPRPESSSQSSAQENNTDGTSGWMNWLLHATELLTALIFSLGLLADHLIRLNPALAARPITAQIIAAAAIVLTMTGLKRLRR